MNLIEKKKVFHINSFYRVEGSSNNFSYKLDMKTDDDFDKVVCLKAQIPKSYYSIRAGKNMFKVWIDDNGSITIYDIYIPIGNYNRRSLAVVLQNVLTTTTGFNWTVSFTNGINDADTGKYTFSVPYGGNWQEVSFQFFDNVYYALGFHANTTYQLDGSGLNFTITSPNIIDLQLENVIYIRSDIVANPEGNNILADVYTSGEPSYSNILYSMLPDLEVASKDISTSKNNIYNFYLTDELSTEIDLNGLDWNITLMCYKSNKLGDKLKGFINLATLKI